MIEYTDLSNLPPEIKCLDNFCIPEYNEYLSRKYIDSGIVPFGLASTTSGDKYNPHFKDNFIEKDHDFMACHIVLKPPYIFSESIYDFVPFIDMLTFTYRCKVNITMKYGDENLPYDLHTDLMENEIAMGTYRSAIYFLNDNNGATEIRNPNGEVYYIKSDGNRLISFPGTWAHCGWSATDVKLRGLVNFVYFGDANYEYMDNAYEGQLTIADRGMMQLSQQSRN